MSFFDVLILDSVLIICPFGLLFVLKLKNNINKALENYLLDISLFTIFFLLLKYSNYSNSYGMIMINIPLIISYLYKRNVTSFVLTILIVLFYYDLGFNLIIILTEYILYFIIFILSKKKVQDLNFLFLVFLFIKGFCLTIEYYYILGNNTYFGIFQVFISLTFFYFVGLGVISLINMTNEMISFNNVVKELEKEKSLKQALFKITHEVKNPIAVCKGYLSMMDYSDLDKVKKYNKIINGELTRTLDIMDNFSMYTKIKVNLDVMDINYVVKETLESMKQYLKNNDIDLKYKYSDEEIFINGDYERLKQVLINIIKNATEAIKENGIIEVSVKKNKKSVSLHIKDNGCGMTKEELSKIYDLFYSSKEKGLGIGVPLSKEIIRLHHGKMEYKSKENEYTKIIITLPVINI